MDPFTRLFVEAFGLPWFQVETGQTSSSNMGIPVNFYETRTDVIVELGLPGYSKDDVEVRINGKRLHIIAQCRNSENFLESKVYTHNCAHVNIDKEFELPAFLDVNNVSVSMSNGLLRIVFKRLSEEEQKLPISEHVDQYVRDADGA